jgi:hypothetical protein
MTARTNSATAEGPRLALPTASLLIRPTIHCVVVGAIWAAGAALLGLSLDDALGALAAGGGAAVAFIVSMLLIRPWRKRPTTVWPFVFLLGTLIVTPFTLGVGLLLYSATRLGTVSTWLCLVASFWAGLWGLVQVYGSFMRRNAPPGSPPAEADRSE